MGKRWWNDSRFLLRLNRGLKWFWLAMMPVVATVSALKHNVTLVLLLSLYANMAANWSAERALESELSSGEG